MSSASPANGGATAFRQFRPSVCLCACRQPGTVKAAASNTAAYVGGAAVVLVLGAAGAYFYTSQQSRGSYEQIPHSKDDDAPHNGHSTPPRVEVEDIADEL